MMSDKTAVGVKRAPVDAALRRCGLKRLTTEVLGLRLPERWVGTGKSIYRNRPHNGFGTMIEGLVLDREVGGKK
jgi:hypothetical protein